MAKNLQIDGHSVAAIHGNKSQNARQAALKGFADGRVRLLVATDIASRGIDVSGITHVVNFELPDDAENYVHRIGRTGRNGATGIAISLVDSGEGDKLREVEKLIRQKLPATGDWHLNAGDSRPVAERPVPRRGGSQPAPRSQNRPAAGRPARPAAASGEAGAVPAWLLNRNDTGAKPAANRGKPSRGRGTPPATRSAGPAGKTPRRRPARAERPAAL